jgi:hypothetical protein
MSEEFLDDHQLAERWELNATRDAIAKRFQRLRALPPKSPYHLKHLRSAIKPAIAWPTYWIMKIGPCKRGRTQHLEASGLNAVHLTQDRG